MWSVPWSQTNQQVILKPGFIAWNVRKNSVKKALSPKEEKMVPRYANDKITEIFSDINKLNMWQKVELAVILASENLGIFPQGIFEKIKTIFDVHPINEEVIKWWKARDKEITHDLNAFIDERVRHLPTGLHQYSHKGMTSYDTEEPAFALLLKAAVIELDRPYQIIKGNLMAMSEKYRYTPMLGRSHGQEAKIQTFGKRCETWLKSFLIAYNEMLGAYKLLSQSKLSGAIGNYQGLTPAQEAKALEILGLKPFKGATQIMPRVIYLPLANSLEMIVITLTQIAEDIRLGARSGLPIFQEPFGKKQKGSSAMPHKKNTITCEQQVGMLTMARNFAQMLRERAITWEERAIEQSCVERVAWPDLFHVVMQSFKNMIKVLSGLQVFPDNMMIEIKNSRGCYASEDAKDWLKEHGAEFELPHEDAYRIVQLAAFNAHKVSLFRQNLRQGKIESYVQAEEVFAKLREQVAHVNSYDHSYDHLAVIIANGSLNYSDELDLSEDEVSKWNEILRKIFTVKKNVESFKNIFSITYQLRGEDELFKKYE